MNLINKIKSTKEGEEICCYDCLRFHSIPHDNGMTDYCSVKNKFITKIKRKCVNYENVVGYR